MKSYLLSLVLVGSIWQVLSQCGIPVATPVRLVREISPCVQIIPGIIYPPLNYRNLYQRAIPELRREPRLAHHQVIINQHNSPSYSGLPSHSHYGMGNGFNSYGHFGGSSCGFGGCGSHGETKIKIKIKSRDNENGEENPAASNYESTQQIPSAPCPKNYMFSCQPTVSPAPCASTNQPY